MVLVRKYCITVRLKVSTYTVCIISARERYNRLISKIYMYLQTILEILYYTMNTAKTLAKTKKRSF